MHDSIHNLISDVTEGLKDDPELRLDVQAELASHLEETARACAADGMGEDEAAEQAIKSFGAPLDVAGALLEANKGRMKLRALVRLAVKAVLVPVAVLVAIIIGYGTLARVTNLVGTLSGINETSVIGNVRLPEIPRFPSRADRQRQRRDAFNNTYRMWIREKREGWWRKQWEDSKGTPEERYLFAYYTVARATSISPHSRAIRFGDDTSPQWAEQLARNQERFAHFAQDMRLGETIDPQNALYHYRMADAYLNSFCMMSRASKASSDSPQLDDLYDPVDFAKGVAEVRLAYRKPILTPYGKENRMIHSAQLPPLRFAEDYLQYWTGGSDLFPEFTKSREMARKLPALPRLLLRQGKQAEAEALLREWDRFPVQLIRGSDTLIELLVAEAIVRIMGEETATTYEEMGEPERAREVREKMQRMVRPIRSRISLMHGKESKAFMRRYGPTIMGGYAMLGFRPTIDEMEPARRIEQTMLEQLAFSIVTLSLCLLLMTAGIAQFIWHFRLRAGSSAPLLLLPSWRESVRILGYGVIVPIMLYALYTHIPVISGREYGLGVLWPRITGELALLAVVLMVLPTSLADRIIRQRCRRLGVPVPAARRKSPLLPVLIASGTVPLFILAVMAVLARWESIVDSAVRLLVPSWMLLVIIVAALSSLYGITCWLRTRKQRTSARAYDLYKGTVARSLIPIYAAAIILLSLTAKPYLTRSEITWLHEDRVAFPKPDTGGIAPFEYQYTQQLKAEMLKAADEKNSSTVNR